MLTLWGGGHIGSSRMEQSYCTSGFFRQRVTARNHSNHQPRPKRRSIIAYGKRENARHNKMRRSVRYVFFKLFYAFQTFPGKALLFSRVVFFFIIFFVFFCFVLFCFLFCFFFCFCFVFLNISMVDMCYP